MVSPKEILRGAVLSYEGVPKIVQAIGEYIKFEGIKEWIGPSLVQGELISDEWLIELGFEYDPTSFLWGKGPIHFHLTEGGFQLQLSGRIYMYLHELQILYFIHVGAHLKIPKLK